MKNTRYILCDSLNFDGFGIVAIPAAVIAVPFLVWLLCGATVMDSGRNFLLLF